jgi:peptidoglycan/LPS O-acetylase OafA/YrhL
MLTPPKNHIDFIDSFRAIAALYVVMHHCVVQYYDPAIDTNIHLFSIKVIIIHFFLHGHLAVNLFIVLSGYSLMLSVIKNNYQIKGGFVLFLKRRVIRILPTYYASIALSLILIWLFIGKKTGMHWDICIPVDMNDVIRHALLFHDFFMSTSGRINHVLWSIAVEFRIYLFFPLLVWLWKKGGMITALLTSAFISAIGSLILIYLSHINSDIYLASSGVSPYILSFTFGMIAADACFSDSKLIYSASRFTSFNRYKKVLICCSYLVLFLFIKFIFKSEGGSENKFDLPSYVNDILFGALCAFMLFIVFVYSHKKITWAYKALTWRPLVFAGTFSYSIYLIHAPLLQIIAQYVLPTFALTKFSSSMILILCGTPLIVACSYAFFYFFEKPFLTLGKSKKN